jgi:hypothetical protein
VDAGEREGPISDGTGADPAPGAGPDVAEGPDASKAPEEAADGEEPEGPAESEAAEEEPEASEAPDEPARGEEPAGRDEPEEREEPREPEATQAAEASEQTEELEPAEAEDSEPGSLPSTPVVEGPRIPASSMDSVTLPERSRHSADPRLHRPRRSVARLPALVSPVDIPEDAEGRIEFVVVRAGADRDQPAPRGGAPPAEAAGRVRHLLSLGSGWVAVGGLAAVLVVVFVVVELLFR